MVLEIVVSVALVAVCALVVWSVDRVGKDRKDEGRK